MYKYPWRQHVIVKLEANFVHNLAFRCGMADISNEYGGPSPVLGSDDAGKCLYDIDDNIVRLCCQGARPCSPERVVWSCAPSTVVRTRVLARV